MSEWKVKRFWKTAQVVGSDDGYSVQLDGRPVRTPAKALLEIPTPELAQAIAAEWDAQRGTVDPTTMPVTCAANAAIDRVATHRAEIVGMLAAYGDSDLTCYRAEQPQQLAERQAAAWDPLLDWAAAHFGARLVPVVGVMHQPQPAESCSRLAKPLAEMTAFELAALYDLVSLSGSLVIALAASEEAMTIAELWTMSRIDEDWQAEQWGEDEEAKEQERVKRDAFFAAARFLALSRGRSWPA